MKVSFYKIIELTRTIKGNNLFAGVTVEEDEEGYPEECHIKSYETKFEAIADFYLSDKYQTQIMFSSNHNSNWVKEYAIVECEIDTDYIDSECDIDLNPCDPKDIVELSASNDYQPLDSEEIVEYCRFSPMDFVVEIKNQYNNKLLDYVSASNFKEAEIFAQAISLDNVSVYKYYDADEYDIIAKPLFYREPSELSDGVFVWDSIQKYVETINEAEAKRRSLNASR